MKANRRNLPWNGKIYLSTVPGFHKSYFLADSFTLMFLRILGKFLSNEEFFRNAEIYMHVTYIVYYIHGFTQISSEA